MRALGILTALAVAVARAEDRPPAPDSIAAVKSDLAVLAASAAETAPSAVNARIDVLPPAAPVATPRPGSDPARGPGQGAHWLVDAMNAQALRPQGQGDGADSIRGELDLLRSGNPEWAGAKETARGGVGAGVEPPAVVNPLDAFMEGWISAHDKGLLLSERPAWPLLESLDPKAEAALRPEYSAANEPANPYLAGPGPAAVPALPDAPALNPAPAPELPAPNLLFGPDPRLLDAPKLDLPDYAQPTDDDKYFKQMKRF